MREPPHSFLYDALPGPWAGWFVLFTILGIAISAAAGSESSMKVLADAGLMLTTLYGAAVGITVAARRAKPYLDAKADVAVAQAESMRSQTQTTAGAVEDDV